MPRKASPAAIALLKFFEQGPGGGPALKPYRCPAGVWTNGYGNTHGVTAKSPPITPQQAESDLEQNLSHYASGVERLLKVTVTQGQFDALACLAFNIGMAAFAKSTLLRLVNAGQTSAASEQFARWVYGTDPQTQQRIKLPGLERRRKAERHLFDTGAFVAPK